MSRIAHLSSAHAATDVRICVKQCRSLAAAGYEVTLIARADANYVENGVQITAVKQSVGGRLGRMLLTGLDVLRKAWRWPADVYHFHDPELIPVGALLRLTGAKVIYDVHEDVPKQILSKVWVPAILRQSTALALNLMEWLTTRVVFSRVVAATPSIAQRFPSEKTCLVQNFPIVDELTPTGQSLSITARPPCIAYIGGITEIRGIREMIAAMQEVKTAGARLILAGEFDDPSLEEQMRTLAGWRHVEFRGWLDRQGVAHLLGEVRVGLVVLRPEPNYVTSYPIKLFEYMSAGLPVIASDFPLWRSIIEDARCGVLVDPQDPTAIAAAIDWMFAHPDEAKAMGLRGREAVETTYNWATEMNKLLAMYRNLLGTNRDSLLEPHIGFNDSHEAKRRK